MNHILFIATYDSLYHVANRVIEQMQAPVTVLKANLHSLPFVYREIQATMPAAAIARGGTYFALKSQLDIPVIELRVSALDVLRAIAQAPDKQGPIGLIGYHNVVYGAEEISQCLQRECISIDLEGGQSSEDIIAGVKKAVAAGVSEFVGDRIGIQMVKSAGFMGRIIETNHETVRISIEEAMRTIAVRHKEQLLTQQYQVVVDTVDEGVIVADETGAPVLSNRAAQDICRELHIDFEDLVALADFSQPLAAQKPFEIKRLKGSDLAINKTPVRLKGEAMGIVAAIQTVKEIQTREQHIRLSLVQRGLTARYSFDDIIYTSQEISHTVELAKRFARSDSNVLIQGPSGSGKELFAHSIHNHSSRHNGPFVAVNCTALPAQLLESELFGYSEGAFTGAKKGGKIGLFELAHNGSIFLDEIGDVPLEFQAKLLRVLQEHEIMRVGDEKIIPVNVRIIAATNVDLLESVQNKQFRADLYYRLNILSISIPPLRERRDDILLLAQKKLQAEARQNAKKIRGFSHEAIRFLADYPYEGNVRELYSMIERAVILAEGKLIELSDFDVSTPDQPPAPSTLAAIEGRHLLAVLKKHNNNVQAAAKELGISRSTLYRHLKKEGQ